MKTLDLARTRVWIENPFCGIVAVGVSLQIGAGVSPTDNDCVSHLPAGILQHHFASALVFRRLV